MNTPKTNARILLLAAGASRRFGSDKRKTPLTAGDGAGASKLLSDSLLFHTMTRLGTTRWPLTVVLRREDHSFGQALEALWTQSSNTAPLTSVYAEDAELGMGHSLAAGATALAQARVTHLLVALGDMPFIRTTTLVALCNALTALPADQPGVLRVRDQGRAGHPVGFTGAALPALQQLRGDQGARALLKAWASHTQWLDVADPGVLADIDRPNDLLPLS